MEPLNTLTIDEKQSLLRLLNSWREKVRQAAEQEIQDTQKYSLPVLFDLLEEEQKQSKLRVKRGKFLYVAWVVIWILLAFCGIHGAAYAPAINTAVMYLILLRYTGSSARESIIKALVKHQDKQVLPYMIDYYGQNLVSLDLEIPFMRILSSLRTQDTPLLQPKHREALNKYLLKKGTYSFPLKIAILKAYQQIGDASALITVEKLLERRLTEQEDVYRAAEECLPYLQQNVGRVTEIQTLLRASSPAEKQEELLRPLQAEKPEEESLLLRASEKTP